MNQLGIDNSCRWRKQRTRASDFGLHAGDIGLRQPLEILNAIGFGQVRNGVQLGLFRRCCGDDQFSEFLVGYTMCVAEVVEQIAPFQTLVAPSDCRWGNKFQRG